MTGKAAATCLKAVIRAYRYAVSPLLPQSCRFHPTCSEYALDAIDNNGPIAGAFFTAKRLLRCHPFSKGGFDPAPSHAARDCDEILSR